MPDCLLPFAPLWSRVSPFIYRQLLHSLVCMLYLQLQTKMQLSFRFAFIPWFSVIARFSFGFFIVLLLLLLFIIVFYFLFGFSCFVRSFCCVLFFCGCCTSSPEEWIACLWKRPGQIALLMNHIIFIFTPKRLLFLPDAFAEPNTVICQSAWTICFAQLR